MSCDTMERAHWHTFQVLTKRSSVMREFLRRRYGNGRGPLHMWFGVSVENGAKKVPHPTPPGNSGWRSLSFNRATHWPDGKA